MRDRLMVALDMPNKHQALEMRDTLADSVAWLKVGLRLFVAEGPELVMELLKSHKIFLDLKFHDIPNTVAQAVASAGDLGVQMLNVHASGGSQMLSAAAEAARAFPQMKLIAVTVLTSQDLPAEQTQKVVVGYASQVKESGLDGVVSSVHEVAGIKDACGDDFITVTPGIRWGGQDAQDQKRVADPTMAVRAGADYLVIGRPILQAPDPHAAAMQAQAMMRQA